MGGRGKVGVVSPPPQDSVVSSWIDQNIMSRIQRNKLVFVETRDSGEISLALANYFTVSGCGLTQVGGVSLTVRQPTGL